MTHHRHYKSPWWLPKASSNRDRVGKSTIKPSPCPLVCRNDDFFLPRTTSIFHTGRRGTVLKVTGPKTVHLVRCNYSIGLDRVANSQRDRAGTNVLCTSAKSGFLGRVMDAIFHVSYNYVN